MTTVEQPQEPSEPQVQVLPPEEAQRRAHPLPRRGQLVIEDVPDQEWAEFQRVLTDA